MKRAIHPDNNTLITHVPIGLFKKIGLIAIAIILTGSLAAQDEDKKKAMEIYGFIMMDAGYNFDQIHPDWYDVVRPTKLPSFKNQYGTDGNFFFSVRQTRLGFKNYFQTPLGELKTHFEFEMFGTGVDAGQTTIRLRHAYGELGKFGAGQYWSPFMDIDVFPNTVEYWGPNGMAFFRNVQVRFMPIQGDTRLTIALERPGASADAGNYADRVELQNVKPRFPLPDLSAEYRHAFKWGYIELAGIVRRMEWEDLDPNPPDLSGDATGWGLNLSTNIKIGKKCTFRGSALYGEGVENYMNDAPVDVGIKNNPGNTTRPIEGIALPVTGAVAFLDINWNDKFSSSLGYSMLDIDNSDGQGDDAFHKGQYAIANLAYYPVKNAMMVIEFQWGDRENFKDGWTTSITKVQATFKYNFSHTFFKGN
ncbi:MAG TPA: DcaP family trimeric outer membrane transporter [Chitinophagaceae bacterium]|nr:DcaP family trimeric outer membrane transporter [Chitinophagaceae bacterium]